MHMILQTNMATCWALDGSDECSLPSVFLCLANHMGRLSQTSSKLFLGGNETVGVARKEWLSVFTLSVVVVV